LDIEPVLPYVRALDDPSLPPAGLAWQGLHRARATVSGMRPGHVLSLQVTFASGWRARVNGVERPVRADGLGLMVVDAGCVGPCQVDLEYDGGPERRATRAAGATALLAALVLAGAAIRRSGPWKPRGRLAIR
jgi:hypothetical protein